MILPKDYTLIHLNILIFTIFILCLILKLYGSLGNSVVKPKNAALFAPKSAGAGRKTLENQMYLVY